MVEMQRVVVYRDESGIEVQSADAYREEFPRHFHEQYSVGVVQSGALALECRGVRHFAPAGTGGVVNAGEVHAGGPASESGWSFCNFLVPVRLLREVMEELTGREALPEFPNLVFRDGLLNDYLLQLRRVLVGRRPVLERESSFLAALGVLVSRHAVQQEARRAAKDRPGVRRVCEFLEEVYFAGFQLDDLARIAGMSRFHFLRVFRATTGLTPHAYLIQIRVERAKALLAAGEPIATAAQQCGFCDQAHLHRNFKRLFGYTPGQYLAAR